MDTSGSGVAPPAAMMKPDVAPSNDITSDRRINHGRVNKGTWRGHRATYHPQWLRSARKDKGDHASRVAADPRASSSGDRPSSRDRDACFGVTSVIAREKPLEDMAVHHREALRRENVSREENGGRVAQ